MTPERWKQISSVLDQLVDLEPGKRFAFLDLACAGDEDLKRECETFLTSDERLRSFIESSPSNEAAELLSQSELLDAGKELAGRYKIASHLGTGGMAEVYEGQDLRLGRKIAVKVLAPRFAADELAISRFEREARILASLNHPNILAIHDFDNQDGRYFVVTEFLDGETLRDCLIRTPIPWPRTIEIISAISEGLFAAHTSRIIHRDLKPENIFLASDGRVKILDFGLAHWKLSADSKAQTDENTLLKKTRPGTILGTLPYMSPEQVRAEIMDERSDIFSLGCTFYEMLSGNRPFSGRTNADLISSILKDNPPEIPSSRSIPNALIHIVRKCVEKKPDKRFQSARELIVALSQISETATTFEQWKNSIAVLPFEDLSQEKNQEYFCDGMAEEIINSLARIEDLRVVARTSAFSFKGKLLDVREIGKQLDVEAVLEGSVRKTENRLRVTAQLIDVSSGYHLWSEKFDREIKDVFAIQDEISATIVDKLKPELAPAHKVKEARRAVQNLEAYDLCLQGRFYFNLVTPEGAQMAIRCFNMAIEKDPNQPLAYAGLAELHGFLASLGFLPLRPKEAIAIVRQYAEKALALDNTLAQVHAFIGQGYAIADWDWKKAEEEHTLSVKLAPGNALAHIYYCSTLAFLGRHEEALAEARLVQKLDPLSPLINTWAAAAIMLCGHFDEGMHLFQELFAREPNFWNAHFYLSFVLYRLSKVNDAVEEAEKALRLSREINVTIANLTAMYFLTGKKTEGESLLKTLQEKAIHTYVPSSYFAWVYLARGEEDEAYKWLEKAYEEHDLWLCHLAYFVLNPVKDPRIRAIVQKIGIALN